MINFAIGPVQLNKNVLSVSSRQIPYFRTKEFSNIILRNEKLFLKFLNAPIHSRALFLTCSGTGAMESSIINCLTPKDKVLVINGGTFGSRLKEILDLYSIKNDSINLKFGENINNNHLFKYNNKGYTAFLVNAHETSTGVLYNLDLISKFCKRNKMLLIIDAISSFMADEINMKKLNADVVIVGSQKALACAPGISIIALSPRAINIITKNKIKCFYLDLKKALNDAIRGQTPFTPAVGIILQINKRLTDINHSGGIDNEIHKVKNLAIYFRNQIKSLPFKIPHNNLSNALTPLEPIKNISAYDIFTILKDKYKIWVCPNGGDLKNRIFRVGHLGNLHKCDYDKLIAALKDMHKRNII